jgi:hypothetical protein
MTRPSSQPPRDDLNAPDGLISDLSILYRRTVPVPSAVDQAIVAQARRQGMKMRRQRILLRWGGGAAAAAAVLLVALRLAQPPRPSNHVTILDAFSLARQLKSGVKPDKSWDINGDGVIDQKDVDALAAKAVQLPRGGVQ